MFVRNFGSEIRQIRSFSDCRALDTDSETNSKTLESPAMEEKLKSFMSFLQSEVENDQRINLASKGFGLKSVSNYKGSGRGFKYKDDFS